jgi:hypothetical protein
MATLNVGLPEEEWVKILNMLATFPFRDSAPLIQSMQQQLGPQAEQSKMMKAANGLDASPPGVEAT